MYIQYWLPFHELGLNVYTDPLIHTSSVFLSLSLSLSLVPSLIHTRTGGPSEGSFGTVTHYLGRLDWEITRGVTSVDIANPGFAVCCSVLQCVAVCCSVLQCVVVCSSVLQCVAPHKRLDIDVCRFFQIWVCSVLQYVAGGCYMWQDVAVCNSALQCVSVCCSVLWRVATCCSVLHLTWGVTSVDIRKSRGLNYLGPFPAYRYSTSPSYSFLQRLCLCKTTMHCNALQRTALQRTATHCTALRRTAPY